MTKSPTEVKKLVDNLWWAGYQAHKAALVPGNRVDERDLEQQAMNDFLAQIAAAIASQVIGEDEETTIGPGVPAYQRSRLRAEQRAKLKDWIGAEQ